MTKPNFVYVTYIATTPEKVWQALVDPKLMRQYWLGTKADSPAHENISDWTARFPLGTSTRRHGRRGYGRQGRRAYASAPPRFHLGEAE